MKKNPESETEELKSRRGFIQKLGYATPVILSLQALPAMASNGSSGNTDPIDPS